MAQQHTDEELIARFRQSGDNRWLGMLLERHTLLLLGVAMKYLREREQAEDAVQQVFEKTLSSFPAEPIQNVKGWLYIVLRNHCLAKLRQTRHFEPEEHLLRLPSDGEDGLEKLKTKEAQEQQLLACIDELNDAQSICIKMFYLEEKSYKEIMQHTSFTFEQVKSHVQNGKRNLKLALEKRKATPGHFNNEP